MSIQCQESMNFVTSSKLFNKALNYYKDFSNLLKKYSEALADHEKRLRAIYDTFAKHFQINSQTIRNMSENEKDFHRLISSMTDCFGKIVSSQIEANKDASIGLFDIQSEYNTYLSEKKKEYNIYLRDYQDASNDLKNFYKKINSKKSDFFKAAENAEDSLEKICKFRNSAETSKDKSSFKSDYNKAAADTEKNLGILKDKYNDYRKVVANSKSFEDTFILRVNSSTNSVNSLTTNVLEELKKYAVFFSVLGKTSSGETIMEIETFYPTLDKYDITNVFSIYIANNSISNFPLNSVKVQKYVPKILNKFYKTKNTLDFDENEISNNEFIIDSQKETEDTKNISFENVHYIVEKLYKSIHRGLDDQYDVETEKKKFALYGLCQKFMSNKESELTDEELVNLKEYLQLRDLRKFFLQNLNLLRTSGTFQIPQKNHDIIVCSLNIILSFLDPNQLDFFCAHGCVILSETFYYLENGSDKKHYLQEKIKTNKIFSEKAFWDSFIVGSIDDGIKHNPLKTQKKESNDFENIEGGGTAINDTLEDVSMIANIAFGQLISITDNMKQFGVDRNLIRSIEGPFMEKYKISKENREAIFSLI